MAARRICLSFLSPVFFLLLVASAVQAQPVLPDVSGTSENGLVLLSWVCQYTGLKSISVLRSDDSTKNFSTIGNVKKLDKGIQAFVDGHPLRGRSFYKLNIVFASGLSWRSNLCRITVDKSTTDATAKILPDNDSLQRYIITDDRHGGDGKKTPADSTQKQEVRRRITMSFDEDTVRADAGQYTGAPEVVKPKKKIIISFDDPDPNSVTFIKSRFIAPDPQTGHVVMSLPDDVATHHYSVRFYNGAGHMIIEIPRVNAAKAILDKRNFQRKGLFRFVIRRDVIEFESGYIYLN